MKYVSLLYARFAIASYTEGLKAGGSDVTVNTQLYTNRAAAQFHIGNYRLSKVLQSSVVDPE